MLVLITSGDEWSRPRKATCSDTVLADTLTTVNGSGVLLAWAATRTRQAPTEDRPLRLAEGGAKRACRPGPAVVGQAGGRPSGTRQTRMSRSRIRCGARDVASVHNGGCAVSTRRIGPLVLDVGWAAGHCRPDTVLDEDDHGGLGLGVWPS